MRHVTRFIFSTLIAVLPMSMTGCGGSPDGVIKDYAAKVDAGDKAGSLALLSAKGKALVSLMESTGPVDMPAQNRLDHLVIESETIDGDTAIVHATAHYKDGKTEQKVFHCAKESGNWRVSDGM